MKSNTLFLQLKYPIENWDMEAIISSLTGQARETTAGLDIDKFSCG